MRAQVRETPGRGRRIRFVAVAALLMACGAASAKPPAAARKVTPRPTAGVAKPSARRDGALLRWPLEVRGAILSTFGEYRYDHLHAGIDISTGGGTGYKVLAAAAGEVFRLKVEWRGYGRALYVRHPGGRVTVYGHLQRYEDRILRLERLVARHQAAAGNRYPGDIYLDRPLRVARGQVIAYSGESGVGLPHLHFEVREAGDAPIDPFEAGLPRPADRRPPVLESLTITSASASAFVDGDAREAVYPIEPGRGGLLTTDRPVRVSGPFLASLGTYDPTGDSGRAGITSLDVKVDGTIRYRLAFRSFRFDQYPQSGLIFDHRFSRLGPAAFGYRLSRLPGNDFGTAPIDAGQAAGEFHAGAFDLPPGTHVMEIAVTDAAANRSLMRACIEAARPSPPDALEWEGGADDHVLVRFRPLPADAGPAPAGKGAPPPCVHEPRGVEAGFWDEAGRQFLPATCKIDERICLLPQVGEKRRPPAVRLREIMNGVPGPWGLLVRDGAAAPLPDGVAPRVETWPAFMDVLVPLENPLPPSLRLAAGLGRNPLEELSYRDDLTLGAAVDYSRAAGLAPFFILGPADSAPLASLVFDVRWVEPGVPLDYEGPGFSLHFPEKARFFAGPLALRTERTPGTERLPSLTDAIEILPEGETLNDRATLSFELSPGAVAPETLGIYRWDSFRSRWSYEGGDLEEDGARLSLRFRRYGRFALLQDASPPDLREIWPAPGTSVTARRPAFTARVEDEGKGLNYDGVTFELDGRHLESEFDPDRGLSKVLDPPLLSPGTHHLRVVAADLAGNVSEPIEGDFRILPR
jgi:peptidase M23-like protein